MCMCVCVYDVWCVVGVVCALVVCVVDVDCVCVAEYAHMCEGQRSMLGVFSCYPVY